MCAKLNNTIRCDGLLVSSMHLIMRDRVIRIQRMLETEG